MSKPSSPQLGCLATLFASLSLIFFFVLLQPFIQSQNTNKKTLKGDKKSLNNQSTSLKVHWHSFRINCLVPCWLLGGLNH